MMSMGPDTGEERPAIRFRAASTVGWLLSLLLAPPLLAQPSVELQVQTDQPYVGEPVPIAIQVDNAGSSTPPEFPDLPDCSIQYTGSGQQFSMQQDSTGRLLTVRRRSYNFVLVPRKAGELTIPAISIVVDGKTLKTEPKHLRVREVPQSRSPRGAPDQTADEASDLLLVEITCAQSKLYVGQRADFTLTIWVKPARYRGQPVSAGTMRRRLTGQIGPFDVDSERSTALERRMPDGSIERYYVFEFRCSLTVEHPGPLTFDDVAIGINYPTRFSRDLFGDLAVTGEMQIPRVRPVVAAPDVLPLPTEGRPDIFTGAVGKYELSVMAVPTVVRVGDPIELVIDIAGDMIETLPAPNLSAIPELTEDFRVPTETLAGTVSGNHKRFTQRIRAKRVDVEEIPPIEFAYFDPELEQYVVARSESIPIVVSAVDQLNSTDLVGSSANTPPTQASRLETRDGLRGNKATDSELLASVTPVTMKPLVLATFLPPAAFLCIWGVAALLQPRRNLALKRRRSALRNADRRIHSAIARKLPPGELHSEIQAALASYLGDRLDEPAARFLGPAAVDSLQERGVDEGLVQRFADVLRRCEQAAYAGSADGDTSLAELARQCTRELERVRL